MSAFALTQLAKADISEIWSYISEDSYEAADRVEAAILDACAFIAEGPMRGRRRLDLTRRPVRFGQSSGIQTTYWCTGLTQSLWR